MGAERRVEFPTPVALNWPGVVAGLTARGLAPTLRMIDGLPAFPDEVPAGEWRELRLGFAAGMVTLRHAGPRSLACVVWGTADAGLLAARDALAEVVADLAGGRVVVPET
jgi:hypothetical protein